MRDDECEEIVRVWRRSRDGSQPWLEARMGHTHEDDLRFFGGTIAKENDLSDASQKTLNAAIAEFKASFKA